MNLSPRHGYQKEFYSELGWSEQVAGEGSEQFSSQHSTFHRALRDPERKGEAPPSTQGALPSRLRWGPGSYMFADLPLEKSPAEVAQAMPLSSLC